MSNRKRPRGRPSKYPLEFQRDAVALVLNEDRSIADVARSVGVNEGTLGNWVAKARRDRAAGADLSADERGELTELRAENAQLRMERDLLKRSMACWVKESTPWPASGASMTRRQPGSRSPRRARRPACPRRGSMTGPPGRPPGRPNVMSPRPSWSS